MAVTFVLACDGCSERMDENTLGRKIVIGCDNQFPPSTFFSYHPQCGVPPMAELARAKPFVLFQAVEKLTAGGRVTIWQGPLVFDPKKNEFSNGYEGAIAEKNIPPVIQ